MSAPFMRRADSIAVDRELVLKGGLYDFVQMAWREVEPAAFLPNWHLEGMCEHMQAVSACEIRNLVINIPPGCGKSLTLNVLWPAWEWIHRPETKWIYASFDASLVGQRDGGKLITLLQSEWFTARWGNFLIDKNPSASNFVNVRGGFRFSTSPGGKGTGRHSNITVVDDPTKPIDAAGGGTIEKKALRKVSDWWGNTMSSRQADPKTHRNVIMQQRVNRRDLAGEMIDAGYEVYRLPMRYERAFHCKTLIGQDKRTVEGELLFPERYGEDEVKSLETAMGPVVAAAQLQQRPTVEGGGIFKRHNWRFWHYLENIPEPCLHEKCFIARRCLDPEHVNHRKCVVLPSEGYDVQSWDMSFKGTDGSDYVGAGLWRAHLANYYLVDMLNERMYYAETKARIKLFSEVDPAVASSGEWATAFTKIVEDTANGPAIASDLKADIHGITLVPALGGKEARASASSPLFFAERVFIPHPSICPLVWIYMAQLESFPRDIHDDLVDMTSQVLLRFRKHGEQFAAAMAKLRGDS